MVNRPFPRSRNSHFKNGAKCETFAVQMSFICLRIKSYFHINGFAILPRFETKGWGHSKMAYYMYLIKLREERKSAEELQSTIFIMDTVGTLG